MAEDAFDIYQTDAGYAAITNPVQRQILESLRGGEKQLPELVEITGRSKPTLSSLHMKELLSRELIEEREHPTDSRRKVYRLRASKIGSSDIPVAQLRDAVQHYVSLAPVKSRMPLRGFVESLAAAPAGTDPKIVWAQARHLGTITAPGLKAGSTRDLWMRVSQFLEQEDLARPLRIDLEHNRLELSTVGALEASGPFAAAILAGLIEGMASGKGLALPKFKASVIPGGVRIESA